MAVLNANTYYLQNKVTTSSPGQLLLMTYDGALRFLTEAQNAMEHRDYEVQSRCIIKAQALLMELLVTLNHEAYPTLATSLDDLYRYLYDRLTHANVYDDRQALVEVSRHLTDLRGAWAEADQLVRSQEPVKPSAESFGRVSA